MIKQVLNSDQNIFSISKKPGISGLLSYTKLKYNKIDYDIA